jgi:PAS domain S-box-containing protein
METKPIKVLLVEDNADYVTLLREILGAASAGQFHLRHADCLATTLELLAHEAFDVVLLDLTLPDRTGLATYTEVSRRAHTLPVVVLTGLADEALAMEAMREGAQDYLVKSQADGATLTRVIRYAIERKRLTEALREREEFFRLMSETMTDLVAVVDRSGTRLYNSPSYRKLLGDPHEAVGTNSFEDVHPDDRPRVEQIFRETLTTGIGQRAEYRFVTRDGLIRHMESQGSVIRDAAGHVLKLVIVSRDVTERRRVEEQLRDSEQRYKRLLDSTTDYIYTVTIDQGSAVATTHGPGCQAVTGYSSAEYQMDPYLWYRMIHEEDRPRVLAAADKAMRGEHVPPFEHRILHKDGSIRWVRNTPVTRKNEAGRVISYDGLISDITARKTAEEQLRNSEALYQSLVESLPQSIFRKDLQGHFTFANPRFCAELGRPPAAVIGKTDCDFFPAELAQKYQEDDRRVIESGDIKEFTEENRTAEGRTRYVRVVKIPVRDAAGRIISLQGIFWDITAQIEAENALQRTLADLKQSHEALKSAQLQLIQAEKMESVGTLAAGVAHEVKNPLQIILMGVDYLTNNLPPQNEGVGFVLNDMGNAVKRADSIVRGLMDFAAPYQLELKEQDLNQVLDQSLALVKYELSRHAIRVEKHLADPLPPVPLDANKIKQVFVNLIINAVHAMPNGGTLTVATRAERLVKPPRFMNDRSTTFFLPGDTIVTAELRDTGGGIPEDKLTKIFDPFFTTKPPGKGTGLGLTVVKRIIELHGANIDIRNHPDGGVRALIVFNTTRRSVT